MASQLSNESSSTGPERSWLPRALTDGAAALPGFTACSNQSGALSLKGKPLYDYA